MIAKISTGSGFAGATRYLLDEREKLAEDRQPTLLGGNMAGRDARRSGTRRCRGWRRTI